MLRSVAVRYQLAQANVAYALFPVDDPAMADFVAQIDEMNELAERSPGFVWRYISDSRRPDHREFADHRVLFNMSVWTSVEALHEYTYRTVHARVYAARRRWFASDNAVVGGHAAVLWWIAEGTLPTATDAKEKLHMLSEKGPTPEAFTFKARFPPPNQI